MPASPENTAPTVSIDGDQIVVTLPAGGSQTAVPTIPEELRDHEIPAFVLEWIMESDEIATIIQELLQAPTRSLCREMVAPTPLRRGGKAAEFDLKGDQFRSPTPAILRGGDFSVVGFKASAPAYVQGLPEGIKIPNDVMEIIAMARKVDAWIWKGMRVSEWALENGAADASWLPAAD